MPIMMVAPLIVGSSLFAMAMVAKMHYDPRVQFWLYSWEWYFKYLKSVRRE